MKQWTAMDREEWTKGCLRNTSTVIVTDMIT